MEIQPSIAHISRLLGLWKLQSARKSEKKSPMLNLKNQVSQQNLSKPQQCGRGKIIKAIAAMQLMLENKLETRKYF